MAVRKDKKSGKWLMDVWVGVHRVRKLLPDKRTAELLEKDLKIKEARGEHLGIKTIKNVTFEAFSRDYLKYVETNLSPGRYKVAESAVRVNLVPFFGPKNLKEITPRMIEDFKIERSRELKASSVNSLLNILSALFNLAIKWECLRQNPFGGIKAMKVDSTEPPSMSIEESNRLLDACRKDRDLYTFTAIGLSTGMRIGEIVNLTWSDVDLSRRVIKVRPKAEEAGVRVWRIKTGEIRDIPANDFLVDVLSRHPRHITSPYVLHHTDGTPLNTQTIRAGMLKARGWAKMARTNPHLLRHTFGTHLAAAGVDLDTIRRLMGHTDIKMTMRYLHAAPDRMKGAVDRLPFGRPIAQNLDSQADGKI